MDKKNRTYNKEKIEGLLHYSKVYHTRRTSVSWGGYSLVNAELLLLKCAIGQGEYVYYHLISGEDLPIKSQDDIHFFFEYYKGKEFVQFQGEKFEYDNRIKYRYFFQDKIGKKTKEGGLISFQMFRVLKHIDNLVVMLQSILHIERNNKIKFQKGAQWFSITSDLARYVVSKENWIKSVFLYTFCADEIFLQTLVINSPFVQRLYYNGFDDNYKAIMRLIDWDRGQPYVFRESDIEELAGSDMLFARKFDCRIDKDVIDYILMKNQNNTM